MTPSEPVLEIDPDAPRRDPAAAPRWAGPVAGLVAGGLAIATGQLVAAVADLQSPLDAVGSEFIDHTPKWLKNLAVDWFDTNDKLALRACMVLTIGVLALVAGALARRRRLVGPVTMALFGAVGAISP